MKFFGRKFIEWKMEFRSGNKFEDLIEREINFSSDKLNHFSMFKLSIGNISHWSLYFVFLFF